MHPELFLTNFKLFYSFHHRPNFYLYLPTLLSRSAHKNCPSSANVTYYLEISVYTWRYLVSAGKSFGECIPSHISGKSLESMDLVATARPATQSGDKGICIRESQGMVVKHSREKGFFYLNS